MRSKLKWIAAGTALALTAACAPVDPGFGEALRYDMAIQTIDPDPVWVIDPSRPGTTAREARLPTELELPIVSLWQVVRPGPRLALHRLEPPR